MQSGYTFDYKIQLDDLDYQRHVGNANWIIILQRCRFDLCSHLGYPYSKMEQDGIGSVVAEANLKYCFPAFNDDDIKVQIDIDPPEKKSIWIRQKCTNQNGKLCLIADMKMVFVNISGKAVYIPEPIVNIITGVS